MSFLKDFKESFESHGVSVGNSNEIGNAEIMDVLDDREEVEENIHEMSSRLTQDVKDINNVGKSLDALSENIKAVETISPVLTGPAVTTINEQMHDTARLLDIAPAEDLAINPETGEIVEVSMEGVMSWLGNVFRAFGQSLTKTWTRLAIMTSRWNKNYEMFKSRISRCYKLLPKRKNPEGGNLVKLDDKIARYLVMNTELSSDLAGDLSRFISSSEIILSIYVPIIEKITANLQGILSHLIALGGEGSAQEFNIDTISELTQIKDLIDTQELGLGNTKYSLVNSRSFIPNVTLVDARPDYRYVLNSYQKHYPTMSNEEIRAILLSVQQNVFENLANISKIGDRLYQAMDNMNISISRIQTQNSEPIGPLNENKIVAGAQVAQKAVQIWNYANLSKLQVRISYELGSLLDGTIATIYESTNERTHSIITYIEEMLIKD